MVKANKSSCGKQISPVVFYGTPHGVPPKRPSSLLRLLREIRVDLSEEDKSDLRYFFSSASTISCFKHFSISLGNVSLLTLGYF